MDLDWASECDHDLLQGSPRGALFSQLLGGIVY
jgi:hypothetical protein